jgi:outer membrane protein TolC
MRQNISLWSTVVFFVFFLCCVSHGGNGLEGAPYGLRECIHYALKHSPLLRSADAAKLASDAALIHQKSLFKPSLDYYLVPGYLAGEPVSPFALSRHLDEEGFKIFQNSSIAYHTTGLGFRYPVMKESVLFGRDAPSVKKAEAEIRLAENNKGMLTNELIYKIAEAYLDINRAKEEIRMLQEDVEYLQQNYNVVLSRFNLLLVTKNELLKAESALAAARANLSNFTNTLAQRKISLLYYMGAEPSVGFDVMGTGDDPFFAPLPVNDVDALLQKAYANNQQLKQQRERVEIARRDLEISKTKRYPTVDLKSDVILTEDYQWHNRSKFNVFLELQMPIYDSGKINSSIETSYQKLRKEELLLQDMKGSVAREVMQVVTDITNLENLVSAKRKELESAQESYDFIKERYTQNLIPLLSLLEAQYKLTAAKWGLIQVNFDYRLSFARLKKIINEIPLVEAG